jgi:ketosteroid isomerase-like protein
MENTSASNPDQIETIERYLAAYNAFDIAGMLALLSANVRFENFSGGQMTAAANGIGEFGDLARQSTSMFSEREQRITSVEQADGAIVIGIAYRARLAVDIADGPRAGTVINLQGQTEFRFDGALIARIVDRS